MGARAADFGTIRELAAGCGLAFERPDWSPDLIARCGLTPPPGP